MTKFIPPFELFQQKYPNKMKKLPNTASWLALLADADNHPAVIDFIERLACESHSLAEALRRLNSLPKSTDGYTCFIGSPSFSEAVARNVSIDVRNFETTYRRALVAKLEKLGVADPVDVAMQVAYQAGLDDGSDY
jgi:hypothetical protein